MQNPLDEFMVQAQAPLMPLMSMPDLNTPTYGHSKNEHSESYINDSPFMGKKRFNSKERQLNFNIRFVSTPHKSSGSPDPPRKYSSKSFVVMHEKKKTETIPHRKKVINFTGIEGKNVFRSIQFEVVGEKIEE
jgi:hypothetical protein